MIFSSNSSASSSIVHDFVASLGRREHLHIFGGGEVRGQQGYVCLTPSTFAHASLASDGAPSADYVAKRERGERKEKQEYIWKKGEEEGKRLPGAESCVLSVGVGEWPQCSTNHACSRDATVYIHGALTQGSHTGI